MNRQQLIEKICLLIVEDSTPTDTKNCAKILLNEFLSNSITIEEASTKYSKMITSRYWESVELPKNLFDNIKKLKKGQLNDIQKIKLVSSIITRCTIEIEYHPDLKPDNTGIYDFLEYLNFLLLGTDKDNKYSIEDNNLHDLLVKYGFITESKEVS